MGEDQNSEGSEIRRKRIIDDLLLDPSTEPIVNVLRIKRYMELIFKESGFRCSMEELNKYSICPHHEYRDQWSIELLRLRLTLVNYILGQLSHDSPEKRIKSSFKANEKQIKEQLDSEMTHLNDIFDDCLSMFRVREFETCHKKFKQLVHELKAFDENPLSFTTKTWSKKIVFLKKSLNQNVKVSTREEFSNMFFEGNNHDDQQKEEIEVQSSMVNEIGESDQSSIDEKDEMLIQEHYANEVSPNINNTGNTTERVNLEHTENHPLPPPPSIYYYHTIEDLGTFNQVVPAWGFDYTHQQYGPGNNGYTNYTNNGQINRYNPQRQMNQRQNLQHLSASDYSVYYQQT